MALAVSAAAETGPGVVAAEVEAERLAESSARACPGVRKVARSVWGRVAGDGARAPGVASMEVVALLAAATLEEERRVGVMVLGRVGAEGAVAAAKATVTLCTD